MSRIFTLVSVGVISNCVLSTHGQSYLFSDEFINSINVQQKLWMAGRNFHKNVSLEFISGLMGSVASKDHPTVRIQPRSVEFQPEEDNFDAREKWPYCKSMRTVRDQGTCGSCWAVAVAAVMTDRFCILTANTESFYVSEQDILTCCPDCLLYQGSVCQAGLVDRAWAFVKNRGAVSGGIYSTRGGCKTYEFKPRKPEEQYSNMAKIMPQKCIEKCTTNSDIGYNASLRRFSRSYIVSDPKSEIYKYGPITATIEIYADFLHYKSGVYNRTDVPENQFIGYHSVKILGWGVDEESQTKYWVAANSWNSKWGDKGFFKIIRDENHCNIEGHMTAGMV